MNLVKYRVSVTDDISCYSANGYVVRTGIYSKNYLNVMQKFVSWMNSSEIFIVPSLWRDKDYEECLNLPKEKDYANEYQITRIEGGELAFMVIPYTAELLKWGTDMQRQNVERKLQKSLEDYAANSVQLFLDEVCYEDFIEFKEMLTLGRDNALRMLFDGNTDKIGMPFNIIAEAAREALQKEIDKLREEIIEYEDLHNGYNDEVQIIQKHYNDCRLDKIYCLYKDMLGLN